MGHYPDPRATATVGIFDDDGPGVMGPWRLCRPCAARRRAEGEPRREIGLSYETDSRCEDCGVLNAAPSGSRLAEASRGPDYLYYLLRGDYDGVPPGVVLRAMRENVPVPAGEAGRDPAGADGDLDNGYERRPAVNGGQPFAPLGRRLSPEELGALQDGDRVLMRLSRLHYPDPLTVFEGEGALYVEGDNLTTRDRSWAEYRLPEDLDPYGGLIAEDYYMELFRPVPRPPKGGA